MFRNVFPKFRWKFSTRSFSSASAPKLGHRILYTESPIPVMGAIAATGIIGATSYRQKKPVSCEEKSFFNYFWNAGDGKESGFHYSSAKEYWDDNPRSGPWADKPGSNPHGDGLYEEKFKKYGYGTPIGDDGIFIHRFPEVHRFPILISAA